MKKLTAILIALAVMMTAGWTFSLEEESFCFHEFSHGADTGLVIHERDAVVILRKLTAGTMLLHEPERLDEMVIYRPVLQAHLLRQVLLHEFSLLDL